MKAILKLIIATASATALLAAAATAETADHSHVTTSTRTSHNAPSRAHGAVSRDEYAPAPSTNGGPPFVQDCVRVAFPQCSGGN
jgi:hypothetical protein